MRFPILAVLAASSGLFSLSSQALTYEEWATNEGLLSTAASPDANPDGDQFVNALEYLFVLDPEVPDSGGESGPQLVRNNSGDLFVRWTERNALDSGAVIRLEESDSLEPGDWQTVDLFTYDVSDPVNAERSYKFQYVAPETSSSFYRLRVSFPFAEELEVTILVGSEVGSEWDSLGTFGDAVVRTQPPAVSDSDSTPNLTKYPEAVGTGRVAFTEWLLEDHQSENRRPSRRSWMGWFLWGDGTPPPGKDAGWPFGGEYDGSGWDYFVYQFPAGNDPTTTGSWNPVRVDQQPLYMQPLRLNYNWAPGHFGYENQPMRHFPDNTKFWKDKTIVRGINLSPNYPYFVQYGDRIDDTGVPAWPDAWRESWIRMKVRPLETLVLVPSNLSPDELLAEGPYNNAGTPGSPDYEPYPYPVWNDQLSPRDQTPFAILTDEIGDWHADIIYEATHPDADGYENNRYRRTSFSQPGDGNYLKLTVAQGSPFVWGELANSTYMNFYNLIRENTFGRIDNNQGSGAEFLTDGPYEVPGVSGVSYVLAYGDQNNPNQWFLNVEPEFSFLPDPNKPEETVPGGFNPPGEQSNHTYFAIYYRTDSVEPVTLGNDTSNGTDAQGNPWFSLEFKNPGKNWFVVGQVPVMRYYHPDVAQDDRSALDQAAKDWADELGKLAFNFPTATSIDYTVTNIHRVDTTFDASFANPYEEAGVPGASGMVASADTTVWTLRPHHYQPLTLGPDLSTAGSDPVVWEPLQTTGIDFPSVTGPANANRSNQSAPSRWTYWHPQGNLKPVVTGDFTISYPFQNFLPVLPPPNWEKSYAQTGIQVVRITDAGTGFERIATKPEATLTVSDANWSGSPASFDVKLEPNTGRILQVDVVNPGSGYPDGNPPSDDQVTFTIDPPQSPGGTQAEGRVQIGGGKVLAVFLNDKGSGYRTTIAISQPGNEAVDPPIVVPQFDAGTGQMLTGLANVISGGSGFDYGQAINATVIGTGSGAVAEVVPPGTVYAVVDSLIGGFNGNGTYPSSGDLATDASRIQVNIPPPTEGGSLPQAEPILTKIPTFYQAVVESPGSGYDSAPDASIVDDLGNTFNFTVQISGGEVIKIDRAPEQASPEFDSPKAITFSGGNPDTPAEGRAYSGVSVVGVQLTGASVGNYTDDVEVSFSGGSVGPGSVGGTFEEPVFDFSVSGGKLVLEGTGFVDGNNGEGFWGPARFRIKGGKGFRAAAEAVVSTSGEIVAVRMLREGSNYPENVDVYLTQGGGASGTGASFDVDVQDGRIVGVDVVSGGNGYAVEGNTIAFMAAGGGDPVNQPAKGAWTEITCDADGSGGLTNPIIVNDAQQTGYLDGVGFAATFDSLPLVLEYFDVPNRQMVSPSQAQGYIARSVPETIGVEQVVFDNVITQYTNLASNNLRPFGGGFGGDSAPDGYGLGNQLSATGKFIGTLFHLQRHVADQGLDRPNLVPSSFARSDANALAASYEFPIYRDNHPSVTLSGALKSSVQGLQRTLTLLHSDPTFENTVAPESEVLWNMEYFTNYDSGAGRIVINPTASLPASGVVSSVGDPPEIPLAENSEKEGLTRWEPGRLWSGFGVSDQWNDQHYFFGYYLGTAGLAALYDGAWLDSISGQPAELWADPDKIGTAIDQWYLSVANDPDNSELQGALSMVPEFDYQKFPFFDQWSGHGWATGIPPGPAGAIENGEMGSNFVPWSIMVTSGTGNFPFGDENENSVWEGLQAFSAAILWGAGTDRKPLVDTGIYLLATGMAASDLYFQDKNYNLSASSANDYSWVPVTTIDSDQVANNGGNNSIPAGTDYNTGAGEAFYTAPEFFGGEAAAGMSLVRKFGPTLNNFFYAFPTGSKFIEAYPPTAWTLGISRNTEYMKRWAGAMMREEWRAARDSALFQPANWLAMAMTSALSGVPYNPGDVPYPMTGTTPEADAPAPYVERLWSSWVTRNSAAGSDASLQPAFKPLTVLHFLHAFEEYGTPDWTYIGKVVNSSGSEVADQILLTASFTEVDATAGKIRTTFVAFNPAWETRYASFDRLASDGTVGSANVSGVLTVPAKKMVLSTLEYDIP